MVKGLWLELACCMTSVQASVDVRSHVDVHARGVGSAAVACWTLSHHLVNEER